MIPIGIPTWGVLSIEMGNNAAEDEFRQQNYNIWAEGQCVS